MDVFIYDWRQLYLSTPIYVGTQSLDPSKDTYVRTCDIPVRDADKYSSVVVDGIIHQGGGVLRSRLAKVGSQCTPTMPMYVRQPYSVMMVGYGVYNKKSPQCGTGIWSRPAGDVTDIAIVAYDHSYRFYVRARDLSRLANNTYTFSSILSQIARTDYWVDQVYGKLLRDSSKADMFYCVHTWSDDALREIASELRRVTMWKLPLHELDIPPVTSFLNNCDIPSSGWIRVRLPVGTSASPSAYLGRSVLTTSAELHMSYADISSSDISKQVNPLVLSMDIETFTPRPNTFPKSHVITDEIRIIGTALKWHMSSEECKRLVFGVNTVGVDMPHIVNVTLESTEVISISYYSTCLDNGVYIVLVSSEIDMVVLYMHYVSRMKPHVVIGWNHLSYDYSYISERYYMLRTKRVNYSRSLVNKMSFDVITWSSSAYKYNNFTIVCADGVIDIDVMQYLMKHENYRQYSLKYVSSIELAYPKIDLDYHEMFKLLGSGSYSDLEIVVTYCSRDTTAPLEIFEKKRVWLTAIEASRVLRSLPRDFFTHGSGSKILSQLHYECKAASGGSYYVMDAEDNMSASYCKYDGAYVIDPTAGIYDCVVSLDFASLYPSIIIHDNICYTTFVRSPVCNTVSHTDNRYSVVYVAMAYAPSRLVPYIMTTSMIQRESTAIPSYYKHQGKLILRFVFNKTKIGIIPELLKRLISERGRCKLAMKSCSEDERDVWDRRQYSYKIAANSVYGILGSKNSMLTFTIAAACVTARGKQHLVEAQDIILRHGGKIIYGDTDSCFLSIPNITTRDEYASQCAVICKEVGELNDNVVNIQFENMFSRMLLLGKKRYACLKHDGSVYRRGVASVRRTKSIYFTTTYNRIIELALDKSCVSLVAAYVKDIVFDVLGGCVGPDDLARLQRWNSQSTARATQLLHEHMTLIGRNVELGSYMSYLPIHCIDRKLRDTDWCKVYGISIDYLYYVEHELMREYDNVLRVIGHEPVVSRIVAYVHYCVEHSNIPSGVDERVQRYITTAISMTDTELREQTDYDTTHTLVSMTDYDTTAISMTNTELREQIDYGDVQGEQIDYGDVQGEQIDYGDVQDEHSDYGDVQGEQIDYGDVQGEQIDYGDVQDEHSDYRQCVIPGTLA